MSLAIFSPESLRRRSGMEICKHLWAQYRMREILKKNLMEVLTQRKPDHEALTQVYTNIDKLPLPTSCKDNLKVLAKATGLVIWQWLELLKSEPDTFFADVPCYIDYLKWTSDWIIDAVETVRSMYYSKVFPDTKETWTELSYYCLKDCLEDFFGRVKLMDYDSFQSQLDSSRSDYAVKVLSFYWAKFMQNRLDECDAYLKSVSTDDSEETLDIKMFELLMGENIPCKYFWQQQAATDDEEWGCYPYFHERVSWHGIEIEIYRKQYDIVNSLYKDINGESDLEKIVYWPFEDFALFTEAFRTLLSNIGPSEVAEIIVPKFGEAVARYRSWYDDDDDISDRISAIFQIIWSAIDDETKVNIRNWDAEYTVPVLSTEVKCLNVILHDRALSGNRRNIIDYIIEELCQSEYNSTSVEQFCAEILSVDEDRVLFMELYNARRVHLASFPVLDI